MSELQHTDDQRIRSLKTNGDGYPCTKPSRDNGSDDTNDQYCDSVAAGVRGERHCNGMSVRCV